MGIGSQLRGGRRGQQEGTTGGNGAGGGISKSTIISPNSTTVAQLRHGASSNLWPLYKIPLL